MPSKEGKQTRGSAEAKTWLSDVAGRIGAAVAAERKSQGLTAMQLATKTSELGFPITRGTIARIEGNLRAGKFDVAELMILAEALRVPPVLLLFPKLPDGEVTLNPKSEQVSSHHALRWFTGESNIHGFSSEDSLRLLILIRRYVELRREFAPALIRARNRPQDNDFEEALRDVETRLAVNAEQLYARGATVNSAPELSALGGSVEADRPLIDEELEPDA